MTLTYSLADQNFRQTKSIGILNLSVQLLEELARTESFERLVVLGNSTLSEQLRLPAGTDVRLRDEAIGGRLGRMWWDQWKVYAEARRAGTEWLFLPKGFASFLARPPVKLAVYAHDAVHDYYRRRHPKSVPFLERHYFEKSLLGVLRHARVILTNSEFTTAELRRLAGEFRLTPPPIHTVGIGFHPVPTGRVAKEDRVLAITSRWPHKRPDLAVKFLREWQERTHYAGQVDWIGSLPDDCPLPGFPNWKKHSRLPEAEFRRLVACARALVYTSDYEGFGMPPVEAVIAGTCPVYSSLEATREVMAGAGSPFENSSADSFMAAMRKAFDTTPVELERWSAELLRRHDWKAVAIRTVTALQQAA